MRFKPGHKAETRLRMLDAAAKHVRTLGPDAIAIAEVMAEAGMTVGAFYRHFDSLEALVDAAIDHMYATSPVPLLKTDDGATPETALRRFLDYYLSTEHRDTRVGGCPLPFLIADATRLPVPVRERLSNAMNAVIDLVAFYVATLASADPAMDCRPLAASIVSETIGTVILARADTDPARSERLLLDCQQAVLRRIGLAPHP